MNLRSQIVLGMGALVMACDERAAASRTATELSCDAPGVRDIVERFGERLQRVSLQAPDSIVAREVREAYAPFVTPELLASWMAEPRRAPGREVSSPWPARIEVRSASPTESACRVEGDVVYASSAPGPSDRAMSTPVTLLVWQDDGWRISAYEARSVAPDSTTATEATDVLRRYYAAINARDFRQAYALWGNGGAASNQTYDDFAAGFVETRRVQVDIGEPGRVEGAAGSRYVEIPVVLRAVTTRGENQRFEGTYVLRRTVVDGAPPEARSWHIYRASLRRTQ